MPSFTQTLALVAATLTLTSALEITSPTKFQLWDSAKTNSISWKAVATDPQQFDVYLSHMAAHPPLYSLLFSDVSASTGSVSVSGLQLPSGEAYQINLVAVNNDKQILAQSQQFNVTGEAVAATSTLDGYTGPTYTPSASGTVTRSATTLTRTTTDASGSATTETATSTASDAEATESSTASGTSSDEAPSQTLAAANASGTPTTTPNAAVANVAASGSLVALFFGVAAFLA